VRARLTALLIFLPLVVWAVYITGGERIASRLSSRYGARILASGDGKFTDVKPFVKKRMKEGAMLATAACLLILVHRRLAASANRRLASPARWIAQGWSAFICLNVFIGIAARTVLFWSLLYTGKGHTHNYTQWSIKRELLNETEVPSQAVLLGASQTRTQIDAKALNERLGSRIWTTELHFPGCTPYDMILCLERLPKVRLDYVVTYLSEPSFFGGSEDDRLMFFFGFRDLTTYWNLGPGRPDFDRYPVCALMGDVFPLYRVWEPLAARARGWESLNIDQGRYDASLESDLVARAQRFAKGMSFGPTCGFQKRAFAAFAKMCRERGSRLVVCCGQLNPILGRALDPALRPDMIAFLREQASHDSNITLLEESQLPRQVEGDYEDLTHVNDAARERFSQYIAGVLDKLMAGDTLTKTAFQSPAANRHP
jgi:hypothetical protein